MLMRRYPTYDFFFATSKDILMHSTMNVCGIAYVAAFRLE
jgi:hypothetical protein